MTTENKHLAFNILIEPLHYGFLVHIASKTYNVATLQELTEQIKDYYENPSDLEKIWGHAVNRKWSY